MNQEEILTILGTKFGNLYVKADTLPEPYLGIESIKAILLGTDPGNNINGETKVFDYVFGLEDGNSPYFRKIQINIDALNNISLENLYVQNLCKNYFNCDASKNRHWQEAAALWVPNLVNEFNQKFDISIPVLISAEIILDVILKNPGTKRPAEAYYNYGDFIAKDENHLGRTVIPFFRHHNYNLSNWNKYREVVDSYFTIK